MCGGIPHDHALIVDDEATGMEEGGTLNGMRIARVSGCLDASLLLFGVGQSVKPPPPHSLDRGFSAVADVGAFVSSMHGGAVFGLRCVCGNCRRVCSQVTG